MTEEGKCDRIGVVRRAIRNRIEFQQSFAEGNRPRRRRTSKTFATVRWAVCRCGECSTCHTALLQVSRRAKRKRPMSWLYGNRLKTQMKPKGCEVRVRPYVCGCGSCRVCRQRLYQETVKASKTRAMAWLGWDEPELFFEGT